MSCAIRPERKGDETAVARLISRAFASAQHANGEEAKIVDQLRAAGDLEIAILAAAATAVIGYVAFSPVRIDGEAGRWFGLGPLAVDPDHQRKGVGAALVKAGLAQLRARGANGCVVLGDPAYYRRFGFVHDPAVTFPGPPAEYFQVLILNGRRIAGTVSYAPAFG